MYSVDDLAGTFHGEGAETVKRQRTRAQTELAADRGRTPIALECYEH